MVLTTLTELRKCLHALEPTQGVELWRFVGNEGRWIALMRPSEKLAEEWFGRVARETDADAHYALAITREGAPRAWLAVAAPREVTLPGVIRERGPHELSSTLRGAAEVTLPGVTRERGPHELSSTLRGAAVAAYEAGRVLGERARKDRS